MPINTLMRRQGLVSSFGVDVHFFFENDPKMKHVFYDDMTVEVMQGAFYFERSSLFIIITLSVSFVVHCLLISSVTRLNAV